MIGLNGLVYSTAKTSLYSFKMEDNGLELDDDFGRAKNLLQCLVASRASFLEFLVAHPEMKWPL